jgi:hypothetical protein
VGVGRPHGRQLDEFWLAVLDRCSGSLIIEGILLGARVVRGQEAQHLPQAKVFHLVLAF